MDLLSTTFQGLSGMANIHPLFVHFPIALLNSFFLTELLGVLLKKEEIRIAATWMLYLGTLGALATVLTGLWAAGTVTHSEEVHGIMAKHRNFGITVLILGTVLSIWRIITHGKFSVKGQVLHLVTAFIMITTLVFGADLGGLMVYKYGVAVKAAPQPDGHHVHEKGHELEDGNGRDDKGKLNNTQQGPHDL